jgi:Rho GDP-dissociation inhibitor
MASEHDNTSENISLDEEELEESLYKVAPKKAISEYVNLDAEDESLARWKKSLGLNVDGNAVNSIGEPGDMRRLVVLELRVDVEGREPFILHPESKQELANVQKNPVTITEKANFQITVKFRVQHDIITGLRYFQVAKRSGITLGKTDYVLGSYPPNTAEKPFYEQSLPTGEAPSGMFARGVYGATTTFFDDDKVSHLVIPWRLQVSKR